ncbi:symmetrical bis(5'-nucleosyl)-tetraphosphatase [Massilia sp. DWR3-1-1]|uniref:symmetrical bis(5'-nucleosyl)-tetraphosphatase n=1 Tax=Massilia sp. DWR3-1-1 TaxID=2804559 RepID=UPI003CF80164
MKTFAIGDLQGCLHEMGVLLERIDQEQDGDPDRAIVFVGDLVNRGPDSLGALRRVMALCEASGGRVEALLGNHDLHLLAVAAGVQRASRGDTFDAILGAPDREVLLDWLRRRPLALRRGAHLLFHAGVLPEWSAEQTIALSREVEAVLQGPLWRDLLAHMYGDTPARWDDALRGEARLRCIVNALTRMRFCTPDGAMVFGHKESAGAPAGSGLLPWFELAQRRTRDVTVVFGHWSALGLLMRADVVGLDSGCVWGGKLSAVCLEDRRLLQVDCPEYQHAKGKPAG